jgi:DNA-binding NarL/FixJ family response regulator
MFQARIADAIRALGGEPLIADGEAAAADALAEAPVAAVVDLHERSLDATAAVATLTAAGVRVLAFGRHTEPGMLRAARDAGAEAAVARSQLVEELPELLRELLAPSAH